MRPHPTLWSRHITVACHRWKPFYNAVSEEPSSDFTGWLCDDSGASRLRARYERCLRLLRNASLDSRHGAAPKHVQWLIPGKGADWQYDDWSAAVLRTDRSCKGLQRAQRRALHRMDPTTPAPTPFANGPLFAVSRQLGQLYADDSAPVAWRRRIEATAPVQSYYARGERIPFVLRSTACYPASFDALNGRWLYEMTRAHGASLNVTLVNTPFMVQHHPWLAFHHVRTSLSQLQRLLFVLQATCNPCAPASCVPTADRGLLSPFRTLARRTSVAPTLPRFEYTYE